MSPKYVVQSAWPQGVPGLGSPGLSCPSPQPPTMDVINFTQFSSGQLSPLR